MQAAGSQAYWDIEPDYQPRRRYKLLLSAYACEPGRGSEEGVGWNTALELSRYHDVWVMVANEYRSSIEQWLQSHPLPNTHFVFVDFPQALIRWRRRAQLQRVHYQLWQHYAGGIARKLHQQVRFDASMHVTYGSYWRPSFLRLLDVPFVWGFVGGADNVPSEFYPFVNQSTVAWDRRKRLVESIGTSDPTVRATARRADVTIVPTRTAQEAVESMGAKETLLIPAMALPNRDLETFGQLPVRHQASPVRFLSMGRAIGWKGLEQGLRAFARLTTRYPDVEYWHDGNGPEAPNLLQLADALGVADKFRLFPSNTRAQAIENLAQSDILLFPCLHDEPGWVVTEALAARRPVVFLLGHMQTPGFDAVSLPTEGTTLDEKIASMTETMHKLAADEALRHQLGEAGREYVMKYYSFERRGRMFSRLFEDLIDARR